MNGFFNQFLIIDLSLRTSRYEPLADEILQRTLGGKGLGVHLLTEYNPQGVDPLSPDNVFIIVPGPATGTRMWSQSRFGAYTKGPATGGFAESYCGGTLAPKIKGCGVDAVLIVGKSDSLTYLSITESGVEFRDASPIMGCGTFDSETFILNHSPKNSGAMVIGPAGESMVAFACIKSDRWRSLGRCGLGAVLGSKKLKGISFAGDLHCDIADDGLVKQVVKRVAQKGKASPVTKLYQKLGTPMQVKVTNAHKCFPTRYWKKGYFDRWEKISADYMQTHFDVSSNGCPTCFLKCTHHSVVKEGRHAGLELDGPEYETIYALGGLNEVDSLEEIAWLNLLCDDLGLDTMSAGNISAFAVEAYHAGKLDFEIDYNQPDKMAELFRLIAADDGVGKLFGKGIKSASQSLGMEDVAIHVKGLEPGGFDPRVLKGMGLSYATSARGACHLRGTFYKAELSGEIDKDQIAGKAELHVDYEDRATIFDSLVLCRFFRDFVLWDELVMLICGLTGMDLTKDELKSLANDITNKTRAYNIREGIDASMDKLPKRFLSESTEEGASMKEDQLRMLIDDYNKIRQEATRMDKPLS